MATDSDTHSAAPPAGSGSPAGAAPEPTAGAAPGPTADQAAGGAAAPARRPRVFSGIQPTGALHLGNYLGAIRNFVAMQETHDCVYCAVDLHAITMRQAKADLKRNTIDTINMFLAAGVDPHRSIVIVQSHVPQHSELAWILNTVAYVGELNRMTQFKDKTRGGEAESIGVGIFDYPVLMAADILLYRADAVPVGEDQKQHVELTRDLAERFNNAFGKTFVVPEPIIRSEGARIMGLDDPAKKMSKSADSAYNFIALTDSPDDIRRKIKRAVTDSGAEVRPAPDKPALTNLLTIYSMLAGESIDAVVARYDGQGYAQFKKDLAEVVVDALAPFQRRMKELQRRQGLHPRRAARRRRTRLGDRRAHHAEGARPHGVRAPPLTAPASPAACLRPSLPIAPSARCTVRSPSIRPALSSATPCSPPQPRSSAQSATACRARRAGGPGGAAACSRGREGAGRFSPPPSRQSRHAEQGQQRRHELACVGARQQAAQGQVGFV